MTRACIQQRGRVSGRARTIFELQRGQNRRGVSAMAFHRAARVCDGSILNRESSESTNKAPLPLILRPSLLTALAFEHAHRSSPARVQHGPYLRRLLAALIARWGRIGVEAGKNFVLKITVHGRTTSLVSESISAQVNTSSTDLKSGHAKIKLGREDRLDSLFYFCSSAPIQRFRKVDHGGSGIRPCGDRSRA
jgi:hypothetical protein